MKNQINLLSEQFRQSSYAVLECMQRGPCHPAAKMSREIIREINSKSMIGAYWNGQSTLELFDIWQEYSKKFGVKGIPMCMFFPYPKETEKYFKNQHLVEANDSLYCFLVRSIESFIVLDKENYREDKISDPYHEKYYFEICGRPTFLLCMSKTIDWKGRYINSPDYACLIVQDHAMFPNAKTMEDLRPVIRRSIKNIIGCPFHKGKKILAYPQEMPLGTEFSEMHITRMDDATGRIDLGDPDSRWFYKQLPGLGLYNDLQLENLKKISKEEFSKLVKR